MRRSGTELAAVISRALITSSDRKVSPQVWSPALEQTLHKLCRRESLSPTLVARVIDPFLLHHHSIAFGFFNWASQQPGFCHSPATYQSVLKALSISRQFNSIDKVLKQVRVHRVPLEPSVYGSIVASFVAGKKVHLAFTVFCEYVSDIVLIGPEICNSLLAVLASEGSMRSARTVFDEMINRGVGLSTLGFGVFVWWVSKKNGLEEVLSLLDEVRKVDFSGINGSVIALLVVHGLCMESKGKDAVNALEELRKRDCKPDFMAYRVAAEMLRKIGSVADVHMVLKKKRKLGVAPRANDYKEFIYLLVSERLISEAKELGEVIVDGNFPIDDDVLNVLIGSVSTVDPLCAVTFLKFMLEKGKMPTLLTLANLSENLGKHEKGDELVDIFQLLSRKEYFTSFESYNIMLSLLCKARRVKEAYSVLQEMKKKGFCPDVSSYNLLLETCCREDLVRPATRLWDEMFTSGCGGNLESYNILIRKFSEIGQIEDAYHMFYHMFGKGLDPDATTYLVLLEGLCRAKDLEKALEIFNKSVEQDVTLAATLLNTFVLCLCREGFYHQASKLLCGLICDMKCLESHVTLLTYLANSGEPALALEHIKLVADNSQVLLHAIQTRLSASLSSPSNSDPVLRLSREVIKMSEVAPENELTPVTVNSLLHVKFLSTFAEHLVTGETMHMTTRSDQRCSYITDGFSNYYIDDWTSAFR
ncbi:pentatricopeptide repeat-containing protein [Dorcoceras hygrometricum]|uniref:Pentatricopeptide repeat-containing protein n=1 Tax=Dorcoceras hygrometricum TaxID=472368 RepID=A0A2Z7AIU1_9LAMI|nr:pentatricopeptide repeat-containing protein [Dorcoceras hygrometricum]